MSSNLNFPQTSLSEIFVDLAAGPQAGVTVVTPTRRLARMLKSEFDRTQAIRGITIWDSADILPISAFVERIYEDVLYSGEARGLPALLESAQEQVLWESAINYSEKGAVLLAVAEAALLAREAWQLAHAWHLIPRLKGFILNEDTKAFRDWSQCYEEMTGRAGQIDRARLYNLICELCGHLKFHKPKRLVCYGFDIVTPQQATLLSKLQEADCEVMMAQPRSQLQLHNFNARRLVHDNSVDEIRCAAVWARARLEANGSARIGVVVPEFSKYHNKIIRIFDSVMNPDRQHSLSSRAEHTFPFNVSLGMTLDSYPLVSAALLMLELGSGEIEFERASHLLRSPFLSGGETEIMDRARLDMRLRKRAESTITLEWLLILIEREDSAAGCPILVQGLFNFSEHVKAKLAGLHKPSTLAREISEALRTLGFPGERDLDSSEYQTLKKWQEILADFAALDSVLAHIRYSEALVRLRHMVAQVMFQPETPDVPIQILGVLESSGMAFDHLWVMGLSDEAWPPQPRPNPFLPVELQQSAGFPQGSAAASLELAHRLTATWLSTADEVVLSHSRYSDDREARTLSLSPLILDIAIVTTAELVLPDYPDYRDLIHQVRRLERVSDDKAPALIVAPVAPAAGETNGADSPRGSNAAKMGGRVRGGVAVIKDHAACQFRALALHRLGAESPESPSAGLDAAERGTLIHHVLALTWSQLKTKDALDTISDDDLEALLMRAAKEAIARLRRDRPVAMSGRFAEIEQRRLMRSAREWLNEDRKRGRFEVVAIEDKRSVEIGGLVLTARLDRVDELADGRRIIIDYKSRAPVARSLLDERPEEPQLPLYLVTSEPDAAAIVFAQVRMGDMRFVTLARDSDLLPGVPAFPGPRMGDQFRSWEELIKAWHTNIADIAASFASGDARVDPKKYPHTCRNCDLRSFCRIDERTGDRGDRFIESDDE
ncbi:PD-(D/E)XK nuclease family protein [Nitrosovibrio tenuis]|uniref:Probable DNA repair protein n=1 Tax=Nitrosovibrio tenuis TaxID=1233 RepID=A0A1H7H7L9_9PROT|nr:PD-(D/E)XK nuclease family protein [Nitrosovibrio tenuis]SEK45292.1 probable DNA repair protein [Nitrosovibrio tenuis]